MPRFPSEINGFHRCFLNASFFYSDLLPGKLFGEKETAPLFSAVNILTLHVKASEFSQEFPQTSA